MSHDLMSIINADVNFFSNRKSRLKTPYYTVEYIKWHHNSHSFMQAKWFFERIQYTQRATENNSFANN